MIGYIVVISTTGSLISPYLSYTNSGEEADENSYILFGVLYLIAGLTIKFIIPPYVDINEEIMLHNKTLEELETMSPYFRNKVDYCSLIKNPQYALALISAMLGNFIESIFAPAFWFMLEFLNSK